MNSISGFEQIKNLNNTILAKCTDYITIQAKFFTCKEFIYYSGIVLTN